MMHVFMFLLVLYLFGAWIFMLWELDPVITSIAGIIALALTIMEDLGK